MPPRTCNISDPLRWDLKVGGREFGMTPETLSRKLNHAEQVSGPDKCYSTAQIVAALFGDITAERLRKTKEEADNMSLKNQILRGESLPRALMTPALEQIFVVIKQLVMASSMTTVEKKDLLDAISTWPVAVKTVAVKAGKQIKLEGAESNGEGAAQDSDD